MLVLSLVLSFVVSTGAYNSSIDWITSPNLHRSKTEFPSNPFDGLGRMVQGGLFAGLTESDFGLDSSTDSGFNAEVEAYINIVQSDFCPGNTKKCSNSFVLGCKCRKAFQKLEEGCSDFPCELFTYVYDNAAFALKKMLALRSFGEVTEHFGDLLTPVLEMVCRCNPAIYNTVEKCVLKYDGMLVDVEDRKEFRDAVKMLDLKAIKKVAVQVTVALCGSTDGECVSEFMSMAVEVAKMLDRATAGEGENQCLSLRRLSDTIVDVIGNTMRLDAEEGRNADDFIQEYLKILDAYWCGAPECAGHLSEQFNTCCTRRAIHNIDMGLIKKALKFADSLQKLLLESNEQGLLASEVLSKKTQKAILKALDPERLCPKLYSSGDTCY